MAFRMLRCIPSICNTDNQSARPFRAYRRLQLQQWRQAWVHCEPQIWCVPHWPSVYPANTPQHRLAMLGGITLSFLLHADDLAILSYT